MHVTSGVSQFQGMLSSWYGWAAVEERPSTYVEGSTHMFKFVARISAWFLKRKLERQYGG